MSRRRFDREREAANDDAIGGPFALQDDASFGPLQDARNGGRLEIARDGSWFCNGRPVSQPELVSFLGGMLDRDPRGSYSLDLPSGEVPVLVQDAPFVGEELFIAGCCGPDQALSIRTNLDEITTIDADHPVRVVFDPDGSAADPGGSTRCYVTVRAGLEARLLPHVFDALSTRGVEHRSDNGSVCFGVWSCESFFPLGCLDDRGALVAPGVEDGLAGDSPSSAGADRPADTPPDGPAAS
ncbi:DUF1285 domain-containing protein [Phaeovibrio sulfidiphilus]|uniref:DUF1285 domain-containing protein n=1 Tax=Phaeovibrio sulfidiphilus TaxID=1220600 RepID=A0A8J6YGY0_9PROT|nr:DUF1285 domain-containing protein [Phaeovibrio sulfidiphilus]MBE1236096.1 DUF1285 domain-containing protein [Phaeovibrio sulfidiphilus]